MRHERLDHMVRGWFIGDFVPTAFQTAVAEVAVKRYSAGDYESRHHHKVATEITLILEGKVQFGDRSFESGDIVILEPGEAADFRADADAVTVVIKIPGAVDDKYSGDP